MRFNGKRALVTGAGQGIGRCVALALARAGAAVGFIDKNGAAGRRTAQWIEAAGGEGWFFEGDLADAPQLTAFADAAIARFGQIDLIVNNACYSNGGLRSGCDRDGLMEVLAVGVAAPYELVRLLGGALAPGAAIVNIGSTRAHMSQADSESYAAAKGGILALTHAMAASLAGRARVNLISPGWIDTAPYVDGGQVGQHSAADRAQHFAGRVGRCEDIATAALFLLHEDASFIDGAELVVDGGMTRRMIYHGDENWALSAP